MHANECESDTSSNSEYMRFSDTEEGNVSVNDSESDTLNATDDMHTSDDIGGNESDNDSNGEDTTDSSEEEEYEDPWIDIIDVTFRQWQPEYKEKVQSYMETEGVTVGIARKRAFQDMKGRYRKTMASVFTDTILWFNAIRKDPIYRAIKKTASDLKMMDDYDSEEAWKYATSKRKYLFEKILKRYQPPEVTITRSIRQT